MSRLPLPSWRTKQVQPSAVPLIDRPDFEDLHAASRFGPWGEQARQMHALGFCTLDIDAEVANDAREVIEKLSSIMAPELEDWETGRAGSPRLQDGWREHPAVRRLALHPRVLDLLRHLYGREPFAFQTLNFAVGSEQAFHSDAVHFHTEPHGFMCGLWIPLADVEPDSGPLLYYPGSHRLPYQSAASLGLTPEQVSAEPHPQRFFEPKWQESVERLGLEPELHLPRRGQALIWHANLLHGGSPVQNRRARRWSQVVHYYFADCLYTTPLRSFPPEQGGLCLREPFDIAKGQIAGAVSQASKLNGTFLPLIKQVQAATASMSFAAPVRIWRAIGKRDPARSLKGCIELITPTSITGWAIHPEIPLSGVQLLCGKHLIASAILDRDRFVLDIPDDHPIPTQDESIHLLTCTQDGQLSCSLNLPGADAPATMRRLRLALSPALRGLVGHFDGFSADGLRLKGWCYSRLGGAATVWLHAKGLPPRPLPCRINRPGMAARGHPTQCGFAFRLLEWVDAMGLEVWVSFDEGGELPLPPGKCSAVPRES
jgi:hypothetical protein